jgi:hypothetical protein
MHMREPTGAQTSFRPDVLLSPNEQVEPSLSLGSEGVLRWVWHSRFGEVLIEVVGKQVFVNGQRVVPYVA